MVHYLVYEIKSTELIEELKESSLKKETLKELLERFLYSTVSELKMRSDEEFCRELVQKAYSAGLCLLQEKQCQEVKYFCPVKTWLALESKKMRDAFKDEIKDIKQPFAFKAKYTLLGAHGDAKVTEFVSKNGEALIRSVLDDLKKGEFIVTVALVADEETEKASNSVKKRTNQVHILGMPSYLLEKKEEKEAKPLLGEATEIIHTTYLASARQEKPLFLGPEREIIHLAFQAKLQAEIIKHLLASVLENQEFVKQKTKGFGKEGFMVRKDKPKFLNVYLESRNIVLKTQSLMVDAIKALHLTEKEKSNQTEEEGLRKEKREFYVLEAISSFRKLAEKEKSLGPETKARLLNKPLSYLQENVWTLILNFGFKMEMDIKEKIRTLDRKLGECSCLMSFESDEAEKKPEEAKGAVGGASVFYAKPKGL